MKKRGTGLAVALYPTGASKGGDISQAMVRVQADGSAEVFLGSPDLGQGIQTVAAQVTAEELGIPYSHVKVFNGDTDITPYSTGSVASRAAFSDSNAISEAAREARSILFEVAARQLGASTDDLVASGGSIYVRDSPNRRIPIDRVARKATEVMQKNIVGRGSFMGEPSAPDPETGACNPYRTLAWCAMVAEVEVDTETGEINVLKLIAAYDVGRAINPDLIEGQIAGGSMMGLGAAVMEQLYPYYPSTDWAPRTLGDYVIPTAADLPELQVEILECPSAGNVYGVKGIGEMTANVPSPAIVSAIHDAIGVWFNEIPVTPDAVLRALENHPAK